MCFIVLQPVSSLVDYMRITEAAGKSNAEFADCILMMVVRNAHLDPENLATAVERFSRAAALATSRGI